MYIFSIRHFNLMSTLTKYSFSLITIKGTLKIMFQLTTDCWKIYLFFYFFLFSFFFTGRTVVFINFDFKIQVHSINKCAVQLFIPCTESQPYICLNVTSESLSTNNHRPPS